MISFLCSLRLIVSCVVEVGMDVWVGMRLVMLVRCVIVELLLNKMRW